MDGREYLENVVKTESIDFFAISARMNNNAMVRLDHAADGLCTEAGEFKDILKKYKFYGKDVDGVNLVEELGDILWYIGIACDTLGVSLEEVMEKNIAKLKARYGDRFSETRAENRDLENEREILKTAAAKIEKEVSIVHFTTSSRILSNGTTRITACGKQNLSVNNVTLHAKSTTCDACLKAIKEGPSA